jgi:putative phosphoesterase
MKLLIISDVHSNLPCLQAVLAKEADSDARYCAGDLVDVGLQPEETVACLRQHQVVSVRGNHDDKVANRFYGPPPATDQAWDFSLMNAAFLSRDSMAYIAGLPERVLFRADGIAYNMQHLYRGYSEPESLEQFAEAWDNPPEMNDTSLHKVCIFGHTHKPTMKWFRDDCVVINPGSVGYNRPNDPSIATRYVTITNGAIELRSLTHDHCRWRKHLGAEFKQRYGDRRGVPADLVDHPWLSRETPFVGAG